jgi:predicted ATPase
LPEKQPGLVLPVLAGLPGIAGTFEYLKDMSFYDIAPSAVRESLIKGERPTKSGAETRLDQTGGDFLAVLLDLWTSPSRKIDFVNSLEAALPHAAQLRIEANLPLSSQTFVISELPGQYLLPLREESDGTLRFAAMLLALSQEPAPSLIALEEPELFVHPGAMAVLCELLEEAALTSQIIISTHSPDIISHFGVDELRIVERTDLGTKIGVVDAVQRQVIEEQLFSASDLLRIEGLHRKSTES